MAKAKKETKKVLIKKKYTITVTHYDDGTQCMNRLNDGFNPLELMGVADFISLEIREQIIGKIKPDVVKRKAITD